MPITRNTLVILEAYAKSYEDVPNEAQLKIVNDIRKFCQESIKNLDEYGIEPCISQEELIKRCELLKRQ